MNISDKSFVEKSGKSELYTQSSLINGENSAETIEIDPPEIVKKKTSRFKEVLSQVSEQRIVNSKCTVESEPKKILNFCHFLSLYHSRDVKVNLCVHIHLCFCIIVTFNRYTYVRELCFA